jgi:hypothetical protein
MVEVASLSVWHSLNVLRLQCLYGIWWYMHIQFQNSIDEPTVQVSNQSISDNAKHIVGDVLHLLPWKKAWLDWKLRWGEHSPEWWRWGRVRCRRCCWTPLNSRMNTMSQCARSQSSRPPRNPWQHRIWGMRHFTSYNHESHVPHC